MKDKIKLSYIVIVFISLLAGACSVEPKAINYGADACHYCKMNIVDKQHSAEYVTKKGKAYKFDAIECMINDLKTTNAAEIGLFLVADYAKPAELIDATKATYLISEEIPSPMGAFLSAFSTQEGLNKVNTDQSAQILTWEELIIQFKE